MLNKHMDPVRGIGMDLTLVSLPAAAPQLPAMLLTRLHTHHVVTARPICRGSTCMHYS